MNLIPFQFQSHSIRVVTDESGEPLFVGKDICEALRYSNPSKSMSDHCKGLTKRYPLQTEGGMQELRVLSEPDVLRLIVNCTLPAAQAFEKLVFEEILPSIRKTGRYTSQPQIPTKEQDRVASILLLNQFMANIVGVAPGIAASATLSMVTRDTGINTEPLRLLLPAAQGPIGSLNATAVGEALGVSAVRANITLASEGLQFKGVRGEWELTPLGAKYGEAVPYTNKGHSGYQILWKPCVLDILSQNA